jgi:hypothetical protein
MSESNVQNESPIEMATFIQETILSGEISTADLQVIAECAIAQRKVQARRDSAMMRPGARVLINANVTPKFIANRMATYIGRDGDKYVVQFDEDEHYYGMRNRRYVDRLRGNWTMTAGSFVEVVG